LIKFANKYSQKIFDVCSFAGSKFFFKNRRDVGQSVMSGHLAFTFEARDASYIAALLMPQDRKLSAFRKDTIVYKDNC
jgi:hypothetical protein